MKSSFYHLRISAMALDALQRALTPYVEEALLEHLGDSWADQVRSELDEAYHNRASWDVHVLLAIMDRHWSPAFHSRLGYIGRSLVRELNVYHDLWDRPDAPGPETLRPMITTSLMLLRAVGAEAEADQIERGEGPDLPPPPPDDGPDGPDADPDPATSGGTGTRGQTDPETAEAAGTMAGNGSTRSKQSRAEAEVSEVSAATEGAEPAPRDAEPDAPTATADDEAQPEAATAEAEDEAPVAQFEAPEVDVEVPEAEEEAPETDFEAPEADFELPEMDFEVPEIEFEAPEADFEVPEAESEGTEADFEAPEIDVEAPGVEAVYPEAHAEEPDDAPGLTEQDLMDLEDDTIPAVDLRELEAFRKLIFDAESDLPPESGDLPKMEPTPEAHETTFSPQDLLNAGLSESEAAGPDTLAASAPHATPDIHGDSSDAGLTPRELRQTILDAIVQALEPHRDRHPLPFPQIVVHLHAPQASHQAIFHTAIYELAPSFAEATRNRLQEAGVEDVAHLVVTPVIYREAPAELHEAFEMGGPICIQLRETVAAATATLTVLSGRAEREQYTVGATGSVTIGRLKEIMEADNVVRRNDIAFLDHSTLEDENGPINETVSRRHARLEYDGAAGTFVLCNEGGHTSIERPGKSRPIRVGRESIPLQSGDLLHLGQAQVRFDVV